VTGSNIVVSLIAIIIVTQEKNPSVWQQLVPAVFSVLKMILKNSGLQQKNVGTGFSDTLVTTPCMKYMD
jgi:hypothetical protein